MEARTQIIDSILKGETGIEEISQAANMLKDNTVAVILEALEEISNKKLLTLSEDYLRLAIGYAASIDNTCKREASRIIGNMAAAYPQAVQDAIPALLENARAEGTVVRWGSAYALSRIIVLENYRDSDLYDSVHDICENEENTGIKNQYLKAFKKIRK